MDTPNTYLDLLFGYSALWGIILFFLFRLMRESRRLSESLAELERQLGAKMGSAAEHSPSATVHAR